LFFPTVLKKAPVFHVSMMEGGRFLLALCQLLLFCSNRMLGNASAFPFFALLNDFTDVLLDQDTHPEMTKSPKSKSNSFDYFDEVILSLQFSV
jgi:hypothetical protein